MYAKQHTSGTILVGCFNFSMFLNNNLSNYIKSRNYFFLSDLRHNTVISNVELYVNGGSQLARSAGTKAKVLNWIDKNKRLISLPSWERITILSTCRSYIGISINIYHNKENYSKAGTSIRAGNALRVNGLAMNACDHPHGGRSGPGRALRSPWGWVIK